VVSADIDEWVGIRELLKKLDTEEYDTSRQLAVISLKHADATSVARSLAEGFRAPIEDRARREQMDRQRASSSGGWANSGRLCPRSRRSWSTPRALRR
jgi:hypothetical protein